MKIIRIFFAVNLVILLFSCEKEKNNNDSNQTGQQIGSSAILKSTVPGYEETEPNNNQSQADGPVSYGSIVTGTISNTNDYDFFKLSYENGFSMTLFLNGTDYHVSFHILDASGNILSSGNFQQNVIFNPNIIGIYYLKIYGYSGINYTLSVSSLELNESEPNNTSNQADGPITPGYVFNGNINGNDDWVNINIPETRPVTFFLKGSATYTTAYVYNQSNQLIAQAEENEAVTLNSVPQGNYKVKISGYNGINYTFYFDPAVTVVNPLYFHPTLHPGVYSGILNKYVSSSISFMSYPLEGINDYDNYFPYQIFFYNLFPQSGYDGLNINVKALYSKGFPQLKSEYPVGI